MVTRPKSQEHRDKISAALKAYAARPDAHLHRFHKSGPEHPNWKGGINSKYYQRVAFSAHGKHCLQCGAPAVLVHHVDHNRHNSAPDNLIPMCKQCHVQHHHSKRVPWICPVCSGEKQLTPRDAATRKFCSYACRGKVRDGDGKYKKL